MCIRDSANTILYPHLSSVGELMYLLIIQSGFEIDEYIASKLYCAISFDTGCFKFSNVTANTHLIAAELLQFNLPCSKMNRMMFDSVPLEQLKIENLILRNAELHYDNKIALVCLTQEMVKSIGAKDDDFDGLTALTRRIEGPAVGITMREMPDGSIRVSLRAESDFDVSKVAMKFGGGGHVKAAGCTVNLDMETAKKQIVQAVIGEWTK